MKHNSLTVCILSTKQVRKNDIEKCCTQIMLLKFQKTLFYILIYILLLPFAV